MKSRMRLLLLIPLLAMNGCGMFGGGKDNIEPPAELVDFEDDLDIHRLWSKKVGGGSERLRLGLMPASDGATIYAGAYDGKVSALNSENGRTIWETHLDVGLTAGPAYGSGVIVFGTNNGDVVLLDAQTGEERWRRPVGSEVLAPPAIGSGVVVFRSVDGRLRGLSVADGEELWSVGQNLPALTLRGDASPLVSGQLVVSGFDNGRVGAYDISSGNPMWEIPIANSSGRNELERLVDIGSGIAIVGNDVYAAGFQGRAVSIDMRSGVVIWQQEVSSFAGIGVDIQHVYVTDEVGTVVAYNRQRGTEVWRQDALRLRDVSAPSRFVGVVVVGDYDGYLHFLDPSDGRFRARARAASDRITGPPLIVGTNLYVQGDDGTISAFVIRDDSA